MQYTLIKTDCNFILVSDEEIKGECWRYFKDSKGFEHIHKSTMNQKTVDEMWKGTLKIIALINPIDNLPKLILSDEVASIIGEINKNEYWSVEVEMEEDMREKYDVNPEFEEIFAAAIKITNNSILITKIL